MHENQVDATSQLSTMRITVCAWKINGRYRTDFSLFSIKYNHLKIFFDNLISIDFPPQSSGMNMHRGRFRVTVSVLELKIFYHGYFVLCNDEENLLFVGEFESWSKVLVKGRKFKRKLESVAGIRKSVRLLQHLRSLNSYMCFFGCNALLCHFHYTALYLSLKLNHIHSEYTLKYVLWIWKPERMTINPEIQRI